MNAILLKSAAIALAAPAIALATPAIAAPASHYAPAQASQYHAPHYNAPMSVDINAERSRDRYRGDRYRGGYGNRDRDYGQPVHRNTRVWRGNDGRYYCRKDNGTTGLLIGAAVGGLAGHEIAGRGDRTLGAILGAAGGALLGRAIDRGNTQCR